MNEQFYQPVLIYNGFLSTIESYYSVKKAQQIFNKALKLLTQLSGKSDKEVQEFLQSKYGTWIADTYIDENAKKKKDIEDIIREGYFNTYAEQLFDDKAKGITKKYQFDYNQELFGTKVFNYITNSIDILLATYEHPNRIYKEYALCIAPDRKQYHIGVDFITPIDELSDEDIEQLGIKEFV